MHCSDGQDDDGDALGDCSDMDCAASPACGAPPPDADGDTLADACDPCPDAAGSGGTDSDDDQLGDGCDNCDQFANAGQDDADMDGLGDACEFAWGDVAPPGNPDGTVDIQDVVRVLSMSVGLVAPTPDELRRADVSPSQNMGGSPVLMAPLLTQPPEVRIGDVVSVLQALRPPCGTPCCTEATAPRHLRPRDGSVDGREELPPLLNQPPRLRIAAGATCQCPAAVGAALPQLPLPATRPRPRACGGRHDP